MPRRPKRAALETGLQLATWGCPPTATAHSIICFLLPCAAIMKRYISNKPFEATKPPFRSVGQRHPKGRHQPSVHLELGARTKARPVAGEKGHDFGHLFGPARHGRAAGPCPTAGSFPLPVPGAVSAAEKRVIGASMQPGQTALARMPARPKSTAIERVSASMPPFDVA